jgi:hypothetical protein
LQLARGHFEQGVAVGAACGKAHGASLTLPVGARRSVRRFLAMQAYPAVALGPHRKVDPLAVM